MNRGRAAEISATAATVDVGDVTTRYLLYGLLPGWFVPGLTMTKAGLPIALTLRREVNPGEEQGRSSSTSTASWSRCRSPGSHR